MAENDIYNEIQEDLRQQQLAAFWKENRAWIIGGVVASILFTAALSWWREHKYAADMAATGAFLSAAETADPGKIGQFAEGADRRHAVLAKFAEAGLYAERGEKDKAAAAYDAIARMSRVDGEWKDLARLYAAAQRMESGDPEALLEELDDLSGKKNPWRFTALEMKALLLARTGKGKEAAEILAKLGDEPLAPPGLRARAGTLRALYAGAQ